MEQFNQNKQVENNTDWESNNSPEEARETPKAKQGLNVKEMVANLQALQSQLHWMKDQGGSYEDIADMENSIENLNHQIEVKSREEYYEAMEKMPGFTGYID